MHYSKWYWYKCLCCVPWKLEAILEDWRKHKKSRKRSEKGLKFIEFNKKSNKKSNENHKILQENRRINKKFQEFGGISSKGSWYIIMRSTTQRIDQKNVIIESIIWVKVSCMNSIYRTSYLTS